LNVHQRREALRLLGDGGQATIARIAARAG
jgi:hypothetical protein